MTAPRYVRLPPGPAPEDDVTARPIADDECETVYGRGNVPERGYSTTTYGRRRRREGAEMEA